MTMNGREMSSGGRLRGVVLAGGRGTRLGCITRVANKHLLPVYDRPMIFHGLEAMACAGVREVMVVVDRGDLDEYRRLLIDPLEHGLDRLELGEQDGPKGIADALAVAESFVGGNDAFVLLGDNLFGTSLAAAAQEFAGSRATGMVMLTPVENPREFGIARFSGSDGRLEEIIEKPEHPPTDLGVTGAYFYRPSVFDLIRGLSPSSRGELEITDLNNAILSRGELDWSDVEGWWADAGTPDGLLRASLNAADRGVNGGPARRSLVHETGGDPY